MDIHVRLAGGEGQIKHTGGKASGQERVAVSLLQRGLQRGGAEGASVQEEKLHRAVAAAGMGRGNKACDGNAVGFSCAGEQPHRHIPTQQRINRTARLSVSGGEKLLHAVL